MKTSKWITGLAVLALSLGSTLQAVAGKGDGYQVNAQSSQVKWTGGKVGGEHTGMITLKSGSLEVKDGKIQSGTVTMDMNTITCTDLSDAGYNAKLVGHLKSDDFFGVAAHPEAVLKIKSIESLGGNKSKVMATVTIKGISQDISFEMETVESNGTLTAQGAITIDRSKFNVKYGSGSFFDGLGDNLIYDEFTLDFRLQANK